MSVWPIGDGFRPVSAQSRELLNSWNTSEESETAQPVAENWAARNNLLSDLQPVQQQQIANLPSMEIESSAPVAKSIIPQEIKSSHERTIEKFDLLAEKAAESRAFNKYAPIKDTSAPPLTRVNQILDEHSETSRWLNQRGYLDVFKSSSCVLDITFSTEKSVKVAAVLKAPDGSKRTVVACDDGTTFQRITGPRGQEIVQFMSNGQIVEYGKRTGETLRPKNLELLKKAAELNRIV